jgi:hypothetical protein
VYIQPEIIKYYFFFSILKIRTNFGEETNAWTDVMIFVIIFAEKNGEENGVFDSKQSQIMQKFDHNIGF